MKMKTMMMNRAMTPVILGAVACAVLLVSGCTRLHTFRLDRIDNDVLVTSSSMDKSEYEPIAFLKVSRVRVDPGSAFKRDYESPVGYQLLNDYLVAKARDLGADAVIDVETKYTGGLLFARATATGMAVRFKKTPPPPVTAHEKRPTPTAPATPPAPRMLPDVDLTYGTR